MPLVKTIVIDDATSVLVWKISEPLKELKKIALSDASLKRLSQMRSEIHQKGFVSVRHLLKMVGYADKDLCYNSDGKPHLNDGKHISISHSFDHAAIIIGDREVGIDLEKNREKIIKIAGKFIGTENVYLTPPYRVKQLTRLWAAKESLFKISPEKGLSFKEHLSIAPFDLNDLETVGCVKKEGLEKHFQIFFEPLGAFSMAYALPKRS
jgi:phosphopantetheinyl transferase